MSLLTAHDFVAEVLVIEPDRLTFKVTGFVTCPSDGWSVELVPASEGIVPDPKRAVLVLRAESPEIGPPVVTEVRATYSASDDAHLETIEIRLSEGIETPEGKTTIVLKLKSKVASGTSDR